MTARAGIGIGSRKAVEVAREDQRRRKIGKQRWRAYAFRQRPPLPFLNGPIRREQLLAEIEQSCQRGLKLLPVLQMLGDRYFPADLAALCVAQWDCDSHSESPAAVPLPVTHFNLLVSKGKRIVCPTLCHRRDLIVFRLYLATKPWVTPPAT